MPIGQLCKWRFGGHMEAAKLVKWELIPLTLRNVFSFCLTQAPIQTHRTPKARPLSIQHAKPAESAAYLCCSNTEQMLTQER